MGKRSKKHNYAKGWETRRRNAMLKLRQAPSTVQEAINDMRRSSLEGLAKTPPASGLDVLAESIMRASRNKMEGEKAIRDALERYGLQAAFDAREQERKNHSEHIKDIRDQHAVNIVCAFMATVEAAGTLNGGPLPASVVASGLMMARVYDALQKVGYTKNGFKTQRDALMGKSHADVVHGQG